MSTYTTKGAITEVSIPSRPGVHFVIDSDQEGVVRQVRSWCLTKGGYVLGKHPDHGAIAVHRLLLLDALEDTVIPNAEVDHIDENKLNNAISNLRIVTKSTNQQNKTLRTFNGKNKSSRFPGVCWDKSRRKWLARIRVDNKRVHLGSFVDEEDAARAYRAAFKRLDDVADFEAWRELDAAVPGQTQITNYFNSCEINSKVC
jgi:hypothetical protein